MRRVFFFASYQNLLSYSRAEVTSTFPGPLHHHGVGFIASLTLFNADNNSPAAMPSSSDSAPLFSRGQPQTWLVAEGVFTADVPPYADVWRGAAPVYIAPHDADLSSSTASPGQAGGGDDIAGLTLFLQMALWWHSWSTASHTGMRSCQAPASNAVPLPHPEPHAHALMPGASMMYTTGGTSEALHYEPAAQLFSEAHDVVGQWLRINTALHRDASAASLRCALQHVQRAAFEITPATDGRRRFAVVPLLGMAAPHVHGSVQVRYEPVQGNVATTAGVTEEAEAKAASCTTDTPRSGNSAVATTATLDGGINSRHGKGGVDIDCGGGCGTDTSGDQVEVAEVVRDVRCVHARRVARLCIYTHTYIWGVCVCVCV